MIDNSGQEEHAARRAGTVERTLLRDRFQVAAERNPTVASTKKPYRVGKARTMMTAMAAREKEHKELEVCMVGVDGALHQEG